MQRWWNRARLFGSSVTAFVKWLAWHATKFTIIAAAMFAMYLFSSSAFGSNFPIRDQIISFVFIVIAALTILLVAHKVDQATGH